MYVYFEMDEPTLLRTRRAINEGKIKLPKERHDAGADGPPGRGRASRTRGRSTSSTTRSTPRRAASWCAASSPTRSRRGATGCSRRACSCGSACRSASRTRRSWSSTGPSGRTRGSSIVYVLDADNKVQYRRVTTGALQEDGLRVIEEGLKPDDWVVVGGLQQVRPRMRSGRSRSPCRRSPAARARRPPIAEPARPPRHGRASQRHAVAEGRSARPSADARNPSRRSPRPDQGVQPQPEILPVSHSTRDGHPSTAMISRFFIDRPIFATVLSVVITLIGGIALYCPADRPVSPDHAAGHRRSRSTTPAPTPRWWPTRWRRRSSSRSTASRACSTCRRRWATTARTR